MADHNRDIATAARAVLKPIGCVRKGRSRIWLDDHGWWVGVIEFQPSSWSKGSSLNVAASFLWEEKDSFSFDDDTGAYPRFYAVDGQPFIDDATKLAHMARNGVLELRNRHVSVSSTAAWLGSKPHPGNWGCFHTAMAYGLAGNAAAAQEHFARAIKRSAGVEWVDTLNRKCEELAVLVHSQEQFRKHVVEIITRTRNILRLPDTDALQCSGSG